jgi:hypothetical protein
LLSGGIFAVVYFVPGIDVLHVGELDGFDFSRILAKDPAKEALENPARLRENKPVIADQDWVNGRQAARFHGL